MVSVRHGEPAITQELESLADPRQAAILQRFFKTGPGDYGEGDRFRGIRVPVLRGLVRKYRHIPQAAAESLLPTAFHEDRLLSLLLLIDRYYRGDDAVRGGIHRFYLEHTGWVNNWDLVDASAPHLVGHYLQDRPKGLLTRLAASGILWERRIAILATFHFIKQGDPGRDLQDRRLVVGRLGRLDPQGSGLDASGGGQAGRYRSRDFPWRPLSADAPDHAPVRHREVSRAQAAGLPQGSGPLTRFSRLCSQP